MPSWDSWGHTQGHAAPPAPTHAPEGHRCGRCRPCVLSWLRDSRGGLTLRQPPIALVPEHRTRGTPGPRLPSRSPGSLCRAGLTPPALCPALRPCGQPGPSSPAAPCRLYLRSPKDKGPWILCALHGRLKLDQVTAHLQGGALQGRPVRTPEGPDPRRPPEPAPRAGLGAAIPLTTPRHSQNPSTPPCCLLTKRHPTAQPHNTPNSPVGSGSVRMPHTPRPACLLPPVPHTLSREP